MASTHAKNLNFVSIALFTELSHGARRGPCFCQHLPKWRFPFTFVRSLAAAALALNGGYAKAFYRRGMAQMALGKFRPALSDFRAVARC